MRIGQGYDCHAFAAGDRIILGGISIAHSQSVRAHSDGDVLIHAICDAMLGAIGCGDIGEHFPDSDPRYQDADSSIFLRQCQQMVSERGYKIVNIDSCVILQSPKISPYKQQIRANLATLLNMDANAINVKATTAEGLGAIGAGAGLAAHSVVLLAPG